MKIWNRFGRILKVMRDYIRLAILDELEVLTEK